MDNTEILNQILSILKEHSVQLEALPVIQSDIAELKVDVATLKTDVAELKVDVATLKTDVAELKVDVATLKTDVAELKVDVATLKTDVAELKVDVATLKTDVTELKVDVVTLKTNVAKLNSDMKNAKLDIKILQAEMNTASKQFSKIDRIEADLAIIKRSVLAMEHDHGKKLQFLLDMHEPNIKKHLSHQKRLSSLEKVTDNHSIQIDYLMESKQ